MPPKQATYTVRIGPMYSRFGTDFPWELRTYLDQSLTILTKNAGHNKLVRQGIWDGYKRFFAMTTASFMTGLLEEIVDLLAEKGVGVKLIDEFPTPGPRAPEQPSYVTLRQEEGVNQEIIVQAAIDRKRGIVEAAVNAGKGEIAMEILRRLRLRSLYIVPTQRLYDQALQTMQERLPGLCPIGEIKAGTFAPSLINVAMIQSLSRMLDTIEHGGDDEVRKWIKTVELVMMDECHHAGADKWSLAFKRAIRALYRYGLSGTALEMSKERNRTLIGMTGPVFGLITTSQLVAAGYSVPTTVRFITYPQEPGSLNHISGFEYKTIQILGIQEHEGRGRALYKAIGPHLMGNEKVIIFVNEIEHGNRLAEFGHEPDWRFHALWDKRYIPALLYGTENKTRRREIEQQFVKGERPLLITTLLKEGVNIPEIDVIVNATGAASAWMARQQGGRVVRTRIGKTSAMIYDFIDSTHEILLEHSWSRHRAYKKEGYAIHLYNPETGVEL